MARTLLELIVADKLIASPTEWTVTGRRLGLRLPLEIDGFVEEGFFLRACATASLPDRDVLFQLEYHGVAIPGGTGPLARLEWNTLRPHNNKGKGPEELRFIDQIPTHFHSFEDNWSESEGAMKGDNLPIARPVFQTIQSFTDCVFFVGNLFRINNMQVVKTPDWVYEFDLGMTE